MRTPSLWEDMVAQRPEHSVWYATRMRTMAAEGADLAGEARFVDAMVPRAARILDAGCGPGRVAAALTAVGHTAVGVDVDPVLIEAAREDHPDGTWVVGDLAELDLAAHEITDPFDVIVCAGNVMTFLGHGTHTSALERMRAHLAPEGRIAVGFGTSRGYEPEAFFADVEAAGLRTDVRFSTWDLRPYADGSDFLVAILSAA
jgi:trans-aconitate methyltransferase